MDRSNMNDEFIFRLQEEVSYDIALSNAVILYKKATNGVSISEAADSFNKAIILIEDAILRNKQSSGVQQLYAMCQQQSGQLQLSAMIPDKMNQKECQDSLEQVHHIDQFEDKIVFLVHKWYVILTKGGMITQHVYFNPQFWHNANIIDNKQQVILYRQSTQAIDKLIVLYRYTPESELNQLSLALKDTLIGIYKEYNKNRNNSKENEDLLYWLQMFFRSGYMIVDLLQEKNGKIDGRTRLFLHEYISKLVEICLLDVINQDTPPLPGRFIYNNLRSLAALAVMKQQQLKSIIYPMRGAPTLQQDPRTRQNVQLKGELFGEPINHDGGKPECTMDVKDWNIKCPKCNKTTKQGDWYYDLTLSVIINQYKFNNNKKDIVECVKFHEDGEHEILLIEYNEAVEVDRFIDNDPVIAALRLVQENLVNRAAGFNNVILEQNPELIPQFTKIIDDALK